MPSKATKVTRQTARFKRLQRTVRKKWGNYKYVYLAKVDGDFEASRTGYYWVHLPSGTDSNGNTLYGAAFQMPMESNATFPYRSDIKLETITKEDGITYIKGVAPTELNRMGYDARQFNQGNPKTKDRLLEHIVNLQAYKTSSATSVKVRGSIYRKSNGDYAILQTQDVDIVTGNTPASGYQVVVCLWLDESDNSITTTVSSTEDIDTDFTQASNITTALTLINECADSAPYAAIGLTSWLLYDDATFKKFHDLRGIVGNSGGLQGFPIDVTSTVTIASNIQIVVDEYTISTGGSVVVDGRITVI